MDEKDMREIALKYAKSIAGIAFSYLKNTHDADGTVTGELGMLDMSFEIDQDMQDAYTNRCGEEMAQLLRNAAENNAENVSSFVEPWQYIGYERDDAQVVEAGYSDGIFCVAGKGISSDLYINGRFIRQYENGVYAQDGDSSLAAYRWKVDPSEMNDETVIGLPYYHKDSGEFRMIYLKYNENTGEFAAPADETEYAA